MQFYLSTDLVNKGLIHRAEKHCRNAQHLFFVGILAVLMSPFKWHFFS